MHSISHIAYTDTSSVSLSLLSDSIRLMSVKESEYLHGIAGIAHNFNHSCTNVATGLLWHENSHVITKNWMRALK